jgi:hypothetical protein
LFGQRATSRAYKPTWVESIDVEQIAGRLLGFGTIIMRGTGGSLEPIRQIADPLTFRSHITAG